MSEYWFNVFEVLFRNLPDANMPQPEWTSRRRAKFIKAFVGLLDLYIRVNDNPAPELRTERE